MPKGKINSILLMANNIKDINIHLIYMMKRCSQIIKQLMIKLNLYLIINIGNSSIRAIS